MRAAFIRRLATLSRIQLIPATDCLSPFHRERDTGQLEHAQPDGGTVLSPEP